MKRAILHQNFALSGLFIAIITTSFLMKPGPREIYVSPQGDDNNPGTEKKPLKTLVAAWENARSTKASKGIAIVLREGTYMLANALEMEGKDIEYPVSFGAYPGEKVTVTGGVALRNFETLSKTDAPGKDKVPVIHHDKIWVTNLQGQGITDYGSPHPREGNRLELYAKGQRMSWARYPNTGWVYISKVPQEKGKPVIEGRDTRLRDGIPSGRHYGYFQIDDPTPSTWISKDVWVGGYFNYDWWDDYLQVDRIDPKNNNVYIRPPHGKYGYTYGYRMYFLNALEALDSPGEWYLDRSTGDLYFWPPQGTSIEEKIYVPVNTTTLFDLQGASNITFENLEFRTGRGNAIKSTRGDNLRVLGCTFTQFGGDVVRVEGGFNHLVKSCDVFNTSKGGIHVRSGNRKTLTPGNSRIENNHIHHFAEVLRTYQSGIQVGGVSNVVSHNKIHDTPHQAIGWGGNEHIVEYNEIYNAVTETNDAGAIYSGRNPSMQGNIFRYNYFHNIKGPQGHGTAAIYFDDFHCGNTVYGNVFYRSGKPGKALFGAIFVHGGRYNEVRNNIFIDCERAYGESIWGEEGIAKRRVQHNWSKRLHEDVEISKPPYTEKYPWLQAVETMDRRPNTFERNAVYGTGEVYAHKGPDTVKMAHNFITQGDPDFIRRVDDQVHFNPQLTVREIEGFNTIDFSKIGLYLDEYRESVENFMN